MFRIRKVISLGVIDMSERKYQVCSRCVMKTADPEIRFDEHGGV